MQHLVTKKLIILVAFTGNQDGVLRTGVVNGRFNGTPAVDVRLDATAGRCAETAKDFVDDCRAVNRLAHQGPGSLPRNEPFHPFLYLASHDANPRLSCYLEETKRHGMQPSVDEAYRVGMYLLTSLGKYPILYQGDEVMQRGFKWNGNPPNGDPPGDGSGIFDETEEALPTFHEKLRIVRSPLARELDGRLRALEDIVARHATGEVVPALKEMVPGFA